MSDQMILSKRMKDILLLLYKTGSLTRNDIIFHLEGKLDGMFTDSEFTIPPEHIPKDKIRVSYDRTFKRLRELELLEGGFPPENSPLSPYQGTLWRGYTYQLSAKGKLLAEKIRRELLRSIERYSSILQENLFS